MLNKNIDSLIWSSFFFTYLGVLSFGVLNIISMALSLLAISNDDINKKDLDVARKQLKTNILFLVSMIICLVGVKLTEVGAGEYWVGIGVTQAIILAIYSLRTTFLRWNKFAGK